MPINVGRPRSVRLVEDSLGHERAVVGIVSQRDAEVDEPGFERPLRGRHRRARREGASASGPTNYSVVLHGLARFQIVAARRRSSRTCARASGASPRTSSATSSSTRSARSLREAMREVLALMPNLPRETAGILDNVRESGALADLIASNLTPEQASVADKQKILETFDPKARVRAVLAHRAAASSSSSA